MDCDKLDFSCLLLLLFRDGNMVLNGSIETIFIGDQNVFI